MNTTFVMAGLKGIGVISLLVFLSNFRWFLIALKLRKKFKDNKNNPMNNIKIENDVTALFDKAGVNMIDRRNFMLISKELHSARYSHLLPLFDKAVAYFGYNIRHPFRWLLFTGKIFGRFPPIFTYVSSLLFWFASYFAALYLDVSGLGESILKNLLSLLPF